MKKLVLITAITLMSITSAMTQAAMVKYEIDPPTIEGSFGFTASAGTLSFGYSSASSGIPVTEIAAGDANPAAPINSQNPDDIADAIEIVFGLPDDTFSPGSGSEGNLDGSFDYANIISPTSYDYLAIHFGQYEVFFHFASLVPAGEVFKIYDVKVDGEGGGLSNYRTFNSAVPIPAAAFMFAPALLGFLGLRRKAKNSVA